jgi:hypothetical protein
VTGALTEGEINEWENKNFLRAMALRLAKENPRLRFCWRTGKRRQGEKSFGRLGETLGEKGIWPTK